MNRIFSRVAVATVVLASVLTPSAFADVPGNPLQISGNQLTWATVVPHQQATLTISTPDQTVFEKTFPARENVSLSVFEIGDTQLLDGTYSWQLILSPVIDDATRKAMKVARAAGDSSVIDRLRANGTLPTAEELHHSGYFTVFQGRLIEPTAVEEAPLRAGGRNVETADQEAPTKTTGASAEDQDVPTRDQVILDDLVVDGSACIGFDCVNGESFGFDTIRVKENNLRIKFQDTSSSASFPTNDWQLTANDSANGGANKFSIDDIDGGRTPFTVEAGSPSHSLYVDDGGRVGFGTSTPSVELHVKDGDTPSLRLEQDGSSGFAPQTWDVAGNETNFFVRDVTNGSTLPFRIRPSAPTSAIDIGNDGDVGIGTASPGTLNSSGTNASLHVFRSDGEASIFVQETNSTASNTRVQLELANNGAAQFALYDSNTEADWRFQNLNSEFRITLAGTGSAEMTLDGNGNLWARGDINSDGNTVVPDYVFESNYDLMSIEELGLFVESNRHLPNVPSAAQIQARGSVNMSQMQMRILEKVEELTLYTLAQERTINELKARLAELEQGE